MAVRTAVEPTATGTCCRSVLEAPLGQTDAEKLARGFAALADPVRLRLLSILAAAATGEACVCDVVGPLGKSQPTVSHHLKVLGEAGLVHGERRGRWVWYALDRERLATLRAAIDTGAGGVTGATTHTATSAPRRRRPSA